MSDGLPFGSATNGRSPAHALMTSVVRQLGVREELVGHLQHVADVRGVGPHVVERPVVIGVGRAEDGPLAPGDGEEDALAFGHDHRFGHRHPGVSTTRWMPLVARSFTRLCGRPSAHGPVALTTARARTLNVLLRQAVLELAFPELRTASRP